MIEVMNITNNTQNIPITPHKKCNYWQRTRWWIIIAFIIMLLLLGTTQYTRKSIKSSVTSIIFIRHSVRSDQSCETSVNLTDTGNYCRALSILNKKSRPYDVSIRNCYLIEDAMNYWFLNHINFIPQIIVSSPLLRCIATVSVILRYYFNKTININISEIIVDNRLSESWSAVIRDNNGSTDNINFIDQEQINKIWQITGINMNITVINGVQQSLDNRFETVLIALKEYMRMHTNTLIVTHDVWITRLMDMCLANSTNIIPRHIPETTTLKIDINGHCYIRYPKQECHRKQFINRDRIKSSVFIKHGSMLDFIS